MSVKVMGQVWDTDLPPNMKLVLLAYADAAEHDGSRSYPGYERLTAMTGYSRAQVHRITRRLVDDGWLDQVKGGHTGQRAEFSIRVSHLATQSNERVLHPRDKSVAQLRDTSRPTRPKEEASVGFTQFNASRAAQAVRERQRKGLAVKSVGGLAATIQADPDHIAESEFLWEHRDCEACGGKGFTPGYAPGAGSYEIRCDERTV